MISSECIAAGMASSSRLKNLLGTLLILQCLGNGVLVSADDEKDPKPKTQAAAALPGFGDVVQIAGGVRFPFTYIEVV